MLKPVFRDIGVKAGIVYDAGETEDKKKAQGERGETQ
jgi:hypothetical protein